MTNTNTFTRVKTFNSAFEALEHVMHVQLAIKDNLFKRSRDLYRSQSTTTLLNTTNITQQASIPQLGLYNMHKRKNAKQLKSHTLKRRLNEL